MTISRLGTKTVRGAILAGVAVAALTALSPDWAVAQGQGHGGESAGAGQGGAGSGNRGKGGASDGQGGRSMESILDEEDDGEDTPDWAGERGGNPERGTDNVGQGGRAEDKGGRPEGVGGGDEDSDRPEWAGVPGGKAGGGTSPDTGGGGDLYGDLFVILRDDQGVPILNEDGYVQPIAADGTLIPIDEEGAPIDDTLVQEVEIGRTNVARSPDSVLDNRLEEAVLALNDADSISLDAAGRLVVTTIDEATGEETSKTIDSPLENLALYEALMTDGVIDGITATLPTELSHLTTGDGVTSEDLATAATLLAAATDKTEVFTVDEIAYLNNIIGINPTTIEGTEITYSTIENLADFAYDRAIYDKEVEVLLPSETQEGVYEVQTVNLLDVVFDGETYSGTGTLDAFTQAADDARAVIEYIHNYEVPEAL
jgi:hypothetical protein